MFDTGSTAFMMVCVMLVLLMTPGVAFFYGGMARRKNVVNTMFMSVATIGVISVTWIVFGWSFAYGGDGSIPFFGGFDQIGCLSSVQDMLDQAANTAQDGGYPSIINIVFQLAFCMITTAIIGGSLAGRMKFGPFLAFIAVWSVVVYAPLAHMVWGGEGSLIGETIGALDAFGCHCVGGITGGILTGLFCVPSLSWTDFGGLFYTGDPSLLISQVVGILVTVAFVGAADIVLGGIVKMLAGGLRVSEQTEALGLDVTVHGESAYPAYLGLD